MTTDSALRRWSIVAGAASAIIGVLTVLGALTGNFVIPTFPIGARQPAPWVSVSILLLGLGICALASRPQSRALRGAVSGIAVLVFVGSLISLLEHLWGGSTNSLLNVLDVTRPLGGITLLLASASLALTATRRNDRVAGMLGLAVTAMAFVICLGYVYGGPLLMGLEWVPVPLTSALAALCVGAGLVTVSGPASWPNNLFIGDSVRAVMFRWLVPLMVLAIVITDVVTVNLFTGFSHALGSALNSAISVSVTLVVISYLSRIIGTRIERLNASLNESEQRFTRVFKSVPAGLAITRVDDGQFIEINHAFERIFLFTRDEVIGQRSIDIGSLIDPVERQEFIRRVSNGGGTAVGQTLRVRNKLGEPLVLEIVAQVVEFQGIDALLSSFVDITAQQLAEDALRLSERKFGTIFRESPVALSVTEFETGRLVEVNDAYLELCGASSADEILGKTLLELGIHTAERRERLIIEPIKAGQSKGLIVPVRRLNGEPRTVEISLSTYEVDGKRFILASTIDVTDRLLAEEHARQELAERRRVQKRLDLALRAGGILTFELDPVTRRFEADLGVSDLYGVIPDNDSTISWSTWADRVYPDDLQQVVDQMALLETGKSEAVVDFRVVRPDGSLRYVHGAAALLPADAERPARIVGANIDVTTQKLNELELHKHQQGLEALVVTRTAELRAAKEVAESASRAKGAFLAQMSHEIRTPMNAILGYAQLLQAEGGLDANQRRKAKAIQTSGDHLLGLLNDILEMSRIEAGRITTSIQPFDLHVLLDGVQSMFTELTSQRGLRFSLLIAPGLVRGVQSDPGKIRQVLINLLGNAIKFTDRGTITVRVGSERIDDERCRVTISVEDTGPGIPEEDQEMIFTAFGQAETGRKHSGTGLGLTISRSMAQLLGGDLTVNSAVGQGATFTFTFTALVVPDSALPNVASARGPQRLEPGERRRKVLVVDDVPSNRELLEESLSRAGFETRGASSGEQAIEVHSQWRPDLVLMDLHMPGMGGLAAIKILRESDAQAVIIVTTAGAGDETAATVSKAGAASVLRKPYRESELFDAIAGAMGVRFAIDSDAPKSTLMPVTANLGSMMRGVPADLIAELRDASRQARASRLLELANRVALHSPHAATAIRELTNGFRYRTLLDALDGADANS